MYEDGKNFETQSTQYDKDPADLFLEELRDVAWKLQVKAKNGEITDEEQDYLDRVVADARKRLEASRATAGSPSVESNEWALTYIIKPPDWSFEDTK